MSENKRGAAFLKLQGIEKAFGGHVALHPLDLSVDRGDFLALLGPSGCGKTTLLRTIGGFLQPDSGHIIIDGEDVTALGPERRNTNMVFQGYGLFPHMTVRENVAYGLKIRKLSAENRARDVGAMLELMHISKLADRRPDALSGGQRQRVALARALVMKPSVLLLDEPLAALDLQLRKSMQTELRNLHREIGGTFICVTHDQEEAIALANRVAVMNAGRIVQEGSPEDIYKRPHSVFVAGFIGDSNIIPLVRSAGTCALGGNIVPSNGEDAPVSLMVRPGDVHLVDAPDGKAIALPGEVTDVVFMGDHLKCTIATDLGPTLIAHASQDKCAREIARGKRMYASWEPSDCRILEAT